MVGQINGYAQTGEWVGPAYDFITIYTPIPMGQTGVVGTTSEYGIVGSLSSTNSITINGTTYTSDSTFNIARSKQSNFDLIIRQLSQKAAPEMVSLTVVAAAVLNGTYTGASRATTFGATTAALNIESYTLRYAVRAGYWTIATAVGTTSYNTNFLDFIEGLTILDSAAVLGGQTTINTGAAAATRNLLAKLDTVI